MNGDVSGAVAGSSIRTSESGMYVLGQGGVNSYSQVERTTPYSAVVGSNAPVPQVGAREQVVAQVQRHSIMGGKAAQDPEATAVYPSASAGSSYPSASGTPARTQPTPQAYPGAGASYQVQPSTPQNAAPAAESKEKRGFPVMAVILGVLAVTAAVLLAFVIYVFTRGYEGPAAGSSPSSSSSSSSSAPTPSASATTEEPVKYSAPAGAITVDSFSSPSGNITCSFTADGVSCGIGESDWAEDGFASCTGNKVGVLTATKDKAGQSCESASPSGGNALAYGAAATKGDYACHSTQDGISCWNTKTGQSFALARGGWMTGTTGEIGPEKFTWKSSGPPSLSESTRPGCGRPVGRRLGPHVATRAPRGGPRCGVTGCPGLVPAPALRLLDGTQDQVRPRGVQGLLIGGLEEAGERVAVQA